MRRKARQRISYVLPLANAAVGHRLGVNGLAHDPERSILYTGGRDGVICAWDIDSHRRESVASTLSDGRQTSTSTAATILQPPPLPPTSSATASSTSSSPPRVFPPRSSSRLSNSHTSSSTAAPSLTPRASVLSSQPSQSGKQTPHLRQQIQAHTHWVNDIALVQGGEALVSASSDVTVKLWRPHAHEGSQRTAATLGLHRDYVKCLASPGPHGHDWVASGGLDHYIRVWDLHEGKGERLAIDTAADDGSSKVKGSVYALCARPGIMASGGPDGTIRLWDPRTGQRIKKFVGHTDGVRALLVSEAGDIIMSAGSDQTVKIWSLVAGRCLHTLTMHNESIWALYSDHPQLAVFYSGDRGGLIAKTDIRGNPSLEEGLSLALGQEHNGVCKLLVNENSVWSATSSSSINSWADVDTDAELRATSSPFQLRPPGFVHRPSGAIDTLRAASVAPVAARRVPHASALYMSNLAHSRVRDLDALSISGGSAGRQLSEVSIAPDIQPRAPFRALPDQTIEGQNGLIKHVLLNDRKRVLTLDTSGNVVLWDLLKCLPVKSFGKTHLDDVEPLVNTAVNVANWCTVDTRTGRLAVALEENYCFDAEAYADEAEIEEAIEIKDDQRINLGKWVLRSLFASLIDEEIRRDEIYRSRLNAPSHLHTQPPRLGVLPESGASPWQINFDGDGGRTPQPSGLAIRTPGLSIGFATPAPDASNPAPASGADDKEEPHARASHENRTSGDYFHQPHRTSATQNAAPPTAPTPNANLPSTGALTTVASATTDKSTDSSSNESPLDVLDPPRSPSEPEKDGRSSGLFGKKFRVPFNRKLGRSPSVEAKPTLADNVLTDDADKPADDVREEVVIEDNLFGVLQRIHLDYAEQMAAAAAMGHLPPILASGLTPSLPSETPVLRPPPATTILVQEDNPDSGGIVDLYRGTIRCAGQDADVLEKVAPMWLGELLLKNEIPFKEIVKVSFILYPLHDQLPSVIGPDGNVRLNANRMLRARKILAYIADRIDPEGHQDPSGLKPEEYLELYCHDRLIPHDMTLATIRAHVWKTGGDVVFYYKGNGRRPELEEQHAPSPAEEQPPAHLVAGATHAIPSNHAIPPTHNGTSVLSPPRVPLHPQSQTQSHLASAHHPSMPGPNHMVNGTNGTQPVSGVNGVPARQNVGNAPRSAVDSEPGAAIPNGSSASGTNLS